MLEPEISFIDSLEQLTLLIETVIKGVCSRLLERSSKDLAICQQYNHNAGQNLALLMEKPFSTISYTEAIKILSESNSSFEHQVSWSTGLQSEHEKFLAGQIFKGPLFVTDYPSHLKAFYMKSNPLAEDTGPTVACVDLLLPDVGELVGGSLREDRIDLLQKRIAQTGLNPSSLKWYLDLRRYGSVPHGGFGLGFERFLQYITGLPNIRDTCLIPRYNGNCNI